jgi:hypothetical protein
MITCLLEVTIARRMLPHSQGTGPNFKFTMTKLDTYFSMSTSYSLAKAESCQTFNQNLVLLFVFSFSSFVQAKFGAFVRIFI